MGGFCQDFRQTSNWRGAYSLNHAHPSARGLVFFWVPELEKFSVAPRELVRNREGAQAGTTKLVAAPGDFRTRKVGRSIISNNSGYITWASCNASMDEIAANNPSRFSVMIIAKPNNPPPSNINYAISRYRSSNYQWGLGHGGADHWEFYVNGAGGEATVEATTGFAASQVSVVFGVCDGANARLYVNGINVKSETFAVQLESSSNAMGIFNRHNGGGNNYGGTLYGAAIWKRALSPVEIARFSLRPFDVLRRTEPPVYRIPAVVASKSNWFVVF